MINDLYANILENLRDGIYFVDRDRRITIWNKAAETITGYSREEVLGRQCQDNILNHIDKTGNQLCLTGCPLHASIQDGTLREAQVYLRHKEGYRLPVTVNVVPIYDDNGEIAGAVEIFTNNSTRVYQDDLVASLLNLVMTDQLTGLSNRRHGETFLESSMVRYRRFGVRFGVVFLDLDNFGACNNTYGHEAGDIVLQGIANSLRYNFREIDIICRWGGEEFVGIIEAASEEDLREQAEKIRLLVENSEITAGEHDRISVTASVGATLVREEDTTETLMERADGLMYQSKENGKNRVTVA